MIRSKVLFIAMLISNFGIAQNKINHPSDINYKTDPKIQEALVIGNFEGIPSPEDHRETEFYEPVPAVVNPYGQNGAPSDAIVLFDGSDMDEWIHSKDKSACSWKLNKGEKSMTVFKKGKIKKGNIVSKRKFGAVQLHLEWHSPPVAKDRKGQARGNSGVYLDSRYEIQILDVNNNETYVNGTAGSIYKQSAPLVNPTVPTGEWNSYDIIYHPPVFKGEERVKEGTMTVFQNGVLIQDHFTLLGTTAYIGWPKRVVHGKGSIMLQDHGSAVSYRNIWVRELGD